ncbi:MAG: hypothetical protein AB7E79_13350 [Rhodospirillaceae bacterium]
MANTQGTCAPAETYRRYAQETRQQLVTVTTPWLRDAFEKVAEEWERMAEHAEKAQPVH